MAVVIRLQGLPIVAGTMDIRHFFSGLTIPDGGVHIVGGDHGEAFIVFATDEDARLGMMRTGGSIKGSKVSLLLSSKTEMQNMIELSRRRFEAGAGAVETAVPTAGNANRQAATPIPTVQPGTGGRSGSHGNQGFSNTPASVTAASASQEPQSNKAVASVVPSFPNSYSSAPTITTALASLNAGPPPIPPLPSMPSMPPMPTLPTIPVPPPVSSLPPVPTVSPLSQGPPVPPMSHLPHMSSLPPFNPSLPPPAGLASGLPLGTPNPMLFNPLSPLASLGLQAQMKAAAAAAVGGAGAANPDELFVLVQNLPFSCSEVEIRAFFRGLGVDGVRLMRDNQGRPTGRAMVKFFSPQESFEAVKRGGGMMGQRFIEITPGSERQWASLNDSGAGMPIHNSSKSNNDHQDQHHRRGNAGSGSRDQRGRSRSPHRQEYCIYLKGLPYEADKKQIKEFFNNLSIIEDSIYIAYGPNGRATGEGFLEFKSEQDYKTALGAHMQYMGSRFIQVHPISRKGMHEKIDSIRKREAQGDGKNSDGLKSPRNCAHITNIPYNVSKKDVRAFLEGVGLYEDTLKVLTDSHGNGLGQAIFQLRTEEDARKAERLHRQKLNGRDAFVHLVTFEQMKEVERNPPPQNKRGHRNQNQQNQNQNQHQQAQPSSQQPQINPFAGMGEEFNFLRNTMGNLNSAPFVTPFSAPGNGLAGPPPLPPLAAGLGDVNLGVAPPLVAGLPGAPILEPPGFRPGAAVGAPFGQESQRGLVPFENANRKGSSGQSRGGGGANNNQGRPGGGAAGGQQGFTTGTDSLRNQTNPGGSNNPNGQRGASGPTIVKLQNMPFTVTVDEIMDFFYGYQVLPGSVCLQFSEKGLPTGEAMVAFQSHEEASAAVMDLNDRPIGARKVKISLG
ncbi:copine-1 isoform X1 [Cheilinus undulatus]|uniref:copine-1 isoform X1 n=1 Tax=Cheilinus undulatus TaxID=241271 RepID=UPI001BD3AAFA|nr:copine-1 isoform X1 [Cheilinus undulatus]XP_041639074.1 copine-1 isoform X1 [Cheilinus undulatus]XP_041639075.1 copine-1 isoform X1 [Cheilinus undulatus]